MKREVEILCNDGTSAVPYMTVYSTHPGISSETSAARITTAVAALAGCRPHLSVDVSLGVYTLTTRREIGIRNSSEGVCFTPSHAVRGAVVTYVGSTPASDEHVSGSTAGVRLYLPCVIRETAV